jgi:hypothetical protein
MSDGMSDGDHSARIRHLLAFLQSAQAMVQKLDGKMGDVYARLADGRCTPHELDNLATLAAGCVEACETTKQRAGELAAWSLDRLDEEEQAAAAPLDS